MLLFESEMDCPRCGQPVPADAFCVRCGEPLRDGGGASQGRNRRAYAASPGEAVTQVALFSTLLPQLPAADLSAFRLAFLGGLVVLLGLVVAGLYPVALVGAAVLVPVLVILYVYSVDVYEDTPLAVLAFTMVWGAAWGVAFGLIASLLAGASSPLGDVRVAEVVRLGVVIPLLGGALMLAGPLVLLRYPVFNDVVDGATFGVASAVSFVGAQVVAGSIDLFSAGPAPIGEPLPWIARILAVAVAMPIVAAGSIGSASGAFWLRYRSPIRDRSALGMAGRPAVAAILAAALVVSSALATYLPRPAVSLAVQLALAAVALVWLRRTLHVGLLEEAFEIEIGEEVVCAECGHLTARHTFCGHCGIALHALPKRRREPGP